MTTIVVARHGETPWNREGRMQGWAPVPLNDTGREQADALGAWLGDRYAFDAVHASDLVRTKETTERVTDHLAHEPSDASYERAWRERDIGVYQGLTYDDVFERYPEFGLGEAAAAAADRTPDSGESLVDVYDRVTDRFEDLLAAGGTQLVVTHGGPVYLLLSHVTGRDIQRAVLDNHIDNCGVTVFEGTEPRVVDRNVREWAD